MCKDKQDKYENLLWYAENTIFILYNMSFHLHTSKWGYDISAWGSPKKTWALGEMLEMWVFLSCNKLIVIARWKWLLTLKTW